ncbi:CDP-alcohol phosphatidyltransferase family protein [Chthonobacter rhizosphaerae]|uniref:CDP-alcohol phosphatidyltransferase family protein n=1 Tax=Chthonobacter rhizosphaerae TaxID=2735553 RepID=UPI0015EFC0AA|nr:CDP-alcohol phosphatidyltransferase family protein [Chthonobacter rhizosphaerae]
MANLTIVSKHQNALIALAVHAFTASGIVLAMLAAFAAYRLQWSEFFAWLGLALIVDGVDGPIARRFEVERRLPTFSGAALDTVVDYVTYVFLPAFAIAFGGFVASTWVAITIAGIIVFTSAMYYADTRMKMKNNAFRGFPVVWNGVAFVFFVFRPEDTVVIGITLALAVLTFMPVAFIHPVRVEKWRPLTLAVSFVWFICAAIALAMSLAPPDLVKVGLLASTLYLGTVAAVQQVLARFKPD